MMFPVGGLECCSSSIFSGVPISGVLISGISREELEGQGVMLDIRELRDEFSSSTLGMGELLFLPSWLVWVEDCLWWNSVLEFKIW